MQQVLYLQLFLHAPGFFSTLCLLNEEKQKCFLPLYPLFKELGFIDINRPLRNENSHVIVLGGSINACKDRYDPFQYLQDIITIIDWADRFI